MRVLLAIGNLIHLLVKDFLLSLIAFCWLDNNLKLAREFSKTKKFFTTFLYTATFTPHSLFYP